MVIELHKIYISLLVINSPYISRRYGKDCIALWAVCSHFKTIPVSWTLLVVQYAIICKFSLNKILVGFRLTAHAIAV